MAAANQQNDAPGLSSADARDPGILSRIHQALEVVHSPHSTNDDRRDAQFFLEEIKKDKEAPFHGYALASDKAQSPVVRHYALSLLDNAIKHTWAEYTEDQAATIRGWVLELSHGISPSDPSYIRNKTAQLWVEIAKRSWGTEWMNMDELLVQLWQIPDSAVHKELVMTVLETLGYETFYGDDVVVAMRQSVLCKGWTEITTPASILAEAVKNRTAASDMRYGDDGWVVRMVALLEQCLNDDLDGSADVRSCVSKALSVLSVIIPCTIPKGMAAGGVLPVTCRALSTPYVAIQKAALEVLHTLYSRDDLYETEFAELVAPMYQGQSVQLLKMLFEWSVVDAENIDDDKYQFAKKFSEMLSLLGNYLDRRFSEVPSDSDIDGFLKLLLLAVQSQSLIISIPVLVTWTRLLNNRLVGQRTANSQLIGPLLELCASRLIRYENMLEDSQDPTYLFLMEDTDTIPERHAFLGNYRRYSVQVIETIVWLTPTEAILHILGQTEYVLQHLYDGERPLDAAAYVRHSMPVLRADAHLTVIDAANKGYMKWRTAPPQGHDLDHERQRVHLEEVLEAWCSKLLEMKFEDPMIRKRVLQALVSFSTTALDQKPGFMLKVLEHILMTWPAQQPEQRAFNEAIKEFQSESMQELQRLATRVPDHLVAVYDQLESRVKEMVASGTLDEKRQIAYQTFLFIIIHRANHIDPSVKMQRLKSFIDPIKSQWESPDLQKALSSYSSFCELMGLDKAKSYLTSRRAHEMTDWGAFKLDPEGLALQAELEERQRLLPLRLTKSFISYSVERLDKASPAFQASYGLWNDAFPIILPYLLQLLSHAHAAHNPSNWSQFEPVKEPVVKRVMTDRFWQAGISEGSKDDFYARVEERRNTLEGLASSIRGSVRNVRETCYAIIYCMSRLEVYFYGFSELPNPLAQALYSDAIHLSAHQQINLLNLTRYLVDDCPVEQREHFLAPLLSSCFRQIDSKINSEWERLGRQQSVEAVGDDLTEEMKSESILRQVTHNAVLMLADLLDPTKKNPPPLRGHDQPRQYPTLRKFCLANSDVVEPLLLFCTHIIRVRDTRCCSIILRVFRSIIPDFLAAETPTAPVAQGANDPANGASPDPWLDTSPMPPQKATPIREYISSEVLRACITSFHEPYFVDLQKDLASLIAAIVVYYGPITSTPRDVLLSLPNVSVKDLDRLSEFSAKPGFQARQQRALVLHLLKDLKGVSIAEMGKLPKSSVPPPPKKPTRSKMAQEFMTPGNEGAAKQPPTGGVDDEGLEGLASLFDG